MIDEIRFDGPRPAAFTISAPAAPDPRQWRDCPRCGCPWYQREPVMGPCPACWRVGPEALPARRQDQARTWDARPGMPRASLDAPDDSPSPPSMRGPDARLPRTGVPAGYGRIPGGTPLPWGTIGPGVAACTHPPRFASLRQLPGVRVSVERPGLLRFTFPWEQRPAIIRLLTLTREPGRAEAGPTSPPAGLSASQPARQGLPTA